ncbi:MAG: leucyl/phenylalanyl-tRNA--protein transferase [Vicinamibacteria bacterium]
MPVFRLDERLVFPPAELAEDGLLAVGGDLSSQRLVLAYSSGIFPWYSAGQPILWHSPDPRTVLLPEELHVPRSLEKTLRRRPYRLSLDTAFDEVIAACARVRRPGQRGTWITREMQRAYRELHRLGLAHSAEAWLGERLVGGVYGVALGRAYFGESMFARETDASKLAFVTLARQLRRWGFALIDCQVHTDHLARFGAAEWPRAQYLAALRAALREERAPGGWHFDADLAPDAPAVSGAGSSAAHRRG